MREAEARQGDVDAKGNKGAEKDLLGVSRGEKTVALVVSLGILWYADKVLLTTSENTPPLVGSLAHIGVFAAFLLAFTNGANDIANSMGTSVGAGALTLRVAIAAGCVFELTGGLIVGPLVSDTLSHGIIDLSSFSSTPNILVKIMFCSILGSAFSTLGATAYGVPVSATKGIITSMVILAIYCVGYDSLNTSGLKLMGLTFIISPLAGLLGSYALYAAIIKIILKSSSPVSTAKAYQPLLVAITVSVSLLSLTLSGPTRIEPVPLAMLTSIIVGGIVGLGWEFLPHSSLTIFSSLFTKPRSIKGHIQLKRMPHSPPSICSPNGHAPNDVAFAAKDGTCHRHPHESKATSDKEEGGGVSVLSATITPLPAAGDFSDISVGCEASPEKLRTNPATISAVFSPLVIMSGCVVSFAHGSNDVSNAAGPLSVIAGLSANPGTSIENIKRPYWTNALAAFGFVCGIIFMGGETIRLVGCKLAKQTASKAFATQFGAACTILVCSLVRQTVSTSHVLVGAVVGASLAERHWLTSEADVDFKVLLKIVTGWVVTVPIAGAIAWICFIAVNIGSGQW